MSLKGVLQVPGRGQLGKDQADRFISWVCTTPVISPDFAREDPPPRGNKNKVHEHRIHRKLC